VSQIISLFIYRLLLCLLLPLVVIVLVLRSFNHSEYRQRIQERLGFVSKQFTKNGIVIHAASVGEVIALKAFVEQLILARPNFPITITTFTPTGSAQVKKMYAGKVQHCYLPLDVFPCTWLFLKRLSPQAVVLMETELWPNFIAQCRSQKIKLQLINGRLSTKSIKSYKKVSWLIKPCLACFDRVLLQSDENKNNFLALGAPESVCSVSGNLKFDLHINKDVLTKLQLISQLIIGTRKVWLVASTHPDDEALILTSFEALKIKHPELLLILVPRHPERFDYVYKLCVESQFETVKRSDNKQVELAHDIWLIDSLGELLAFFGLADIVTMGGSFSTIGGHNPLEPALFKKPIIVGPDMSNFNKVMEELHRASAIVQLSDEQNIAELLANSVDQLLYDNQRRQNLGESAYQVVHANQGASERSVNSLLALIDHAH